MIVRLLLSYYWTATHLDCVQFGVGPEVRPQGAGEAGGPQGQEAAHAEDEGSLLLCQGGDEYRLVGSHVWNVESVPGPDLHVPMTVLLYKLISEVIKSCPRLLVCGLHRLLQADPHDGEALAGEAVQGRPVSHVAPAGHGEVEAVCVGDNLLLPGKQVEIIGDVITHQAPATGQTHFIKSSSLSPCN